MLKAMDLGGENGHFMIGYNSMDENEWADVPAKGLPLVFGNVY